MTAAELHVPQKCPHDTALAGGAIVSGGARLAALFAAPRDPPFSSPALPAREVAGSDGGEEDTGLTGSPQCEYHFRYLTVRLPPEPSGEALTDIRGEVAPPWQRAETGAPACSARGRQRLPMEPKVFRFLHRQAALRFSATALWRLPPPVQHAASYLFGDVARARLWNRSCRSGARRLLAEVVDTGASSGGRLLQRDERSAEPISPCADGGPGVTSQPARSDRRRGLLCANRSAMRPT